MGATWELDEKKDMGCVSIHNALLVKETICAIPDARLNIIIIVFF